MYTMNNTEYINDQKNSFAVNLGLISNVILAFLKVTFGILGHSPALLADGINSTSDVVYYIAAIIFLRISVKPADKEHPYGHRQMENIAAIVVGSFIITTAIALFWNSIDSVYDIIVEDAPSQKALLITLIIALFTIITKIVLTLITRKIGSKTNNKAIKALAYDHLNDVFASLAAAVGIFFSRYGYFWVDPLAGAVVAIFILKTGIVIIKESAYTIMDTSPGEELREQIVAIAQSISGITQVENIRTHKFGQFIVINMDVCIEGALTVSEGDEIADRLESLLLRNIKNLLEVHIHYHPGEE
jgi:cation diffusion facilitator family transporter